MAKKKAKSSPKKKSNSFLNSWKPYFLSAFIISTLVFGFLGREQLKIAYFKVSSIFINYTDVYATKAEVSKIEQILKLHKDDIFGIDVSHYQGIINWEKVNTFEDSIPISFVMIRATAGKNKQDNFFTYNWQESEKKDFLRGAYHYYRPNENSTEQAEFFIKNVELKPGDLAPILDIEQEPNKQSMDSLRKGIQNWLNLVEAHYGKKPILYTGDSFYKDHLAKKGFDDYPIWIANYNNSITEPKNKDWIMWQFSDKGTVNGINEFVDLNVFDGNMKMLKLLTLE